MNKIRQNALMMLALTFIYAGLQIARPATELAWTNITLSIIIPIIAMIFAFNEKDNKWRWSLITIETILFIVMIAMAILK
ncbi:TraX protein [Aerococcus urinaeequi]|uniref:TraX protein n=1 Tax=Aerococcus viridans TaxID=1377 RepID=A0A2N6UEN6_9LACT|nr:MULTISPECIES: TraX protein [Aerococcus]OFU52365.1 TraX protein [Aerococcus sp. HMSC10H05]PMC80063.1 TraX protein [Aerococcus viridans]